MDGAPAAAPERIKEAERRIAHVPLVLNRRNFNWLTERISDVVEQPAPRWWWVAFTITASNPPAIAPGWSVNRHGQGCGSPFVTSTDGTNDMIVWIVGTEGDQRLHCYNGDTGAVVYRGGGRNELMAGTHSYSTTGIVARGRIYIATDNKVYAFAVPTPTPTPTPTPPGIRLAPPSPEPGASTSHDSAASLDTAALGR